MGGDRLLSRRKYFIGRWFMSKITSIMLRTWPQEDTWFRLKRMDKMESFWFLRPRVEASSMAARPFGNSSSKKRLLVWSPKSLTSLTLRTSLALCSFQRTWLVRTSSSLIRLPLAPQFQRHFPKKGPKPRAMSSLRLTVLRLQWPWKPASHWLGELRSLFQPMPHGASTRPKRFLNQKQFHWPLP